MRLLWIATTIQERNRSPILFLTLEYFEVSIALL